MKRDEILDTAKKLVSGDRQADYGDARENFQRIADLWTAGVGGKEFTVKDVAIMMALVKVARLAESTKADSWIDLAGYAALGGELDTEETTVAARSASS